MINLNKSNLINDGFTNLKLNNSDKFTNYLDYSFETKQIAKNIYHHNINFDNLYTTSNIITIYINELNRDFYFRLLNRYPNLTDNEQRLCALVRFLKSFLSFACKNHVEHSSPSSSYDNISL